MGGASGAESPSQELALHSPGSSDLQVKSIYSDTLELKELIQRHGGFLTRGCFLDKTEGSAGQQLWSLAASTWFKLVTSATGVPTTRTTFPRVHFCQNVMFLVKDISSY